MTSLLRMRMVWAGLGLGLAFWLFDVRIHIYYYHGGSWADELFRPEPVAILIRVCVLLLTTIFGAYAQLSLRRAETTQDALHQSEERIRLLLENAFEGVIIFEKGKICEANQAFADMYGYAMEEVIGLSHIDLTTPESAEKIAYHLAAKDEKPYEIVGLKKDGTHFDLEVIGKNCRYRGGDARITAMRDITERKRAENQLRLIQFSIDNNSVATYHIKSDSSICYANKAACQALGYTRGELLSLSIPDIDPDFPEEAWAAHWRDMKEAGSMTFEARHKTKDGRVFLVEIQSSFLQYDGDEYIWAYVRDLSEKRAAEKVLQASEERFRIAFNSSAIGMAICSPTGAFLDVNEVLCETIGYSADEMMALDFQSITHPDDLVGSKNMREQLLNGDVQRIHAEKRYVHKKGNTVWARLSAALMTDDTGSPLSMLAQIEDITDRVEAEQRLHVAEARSREVLETAADAIVTIDRKGVIGLFNPAASEMFGYGPEEAIGRNIRMLMPEPDGNRHDFYLARYLDTKEKRIIGTKREVIALKKNGQLFPVELSISEAWTDGEPTFTGIVRDISERKLAEDQMREHAALVEIAPSAILLLNLDDTVKFCNRATEEIYGWPKEEILGRCWDELAFEPESCEYSDLKESTLNQGSWHGELKQVHQSGRELALDAHTVLLRDDRGRPRSVVLVCNDITQKKALELQHLHSQRLESLGTLAAGIAHDLNNILAPILMAIAPLRDSLKEEHALEILDTVLNCAERGSKIVRQVLTFAKGNEGTRERLSPEAALLETKGIVSDTFPKSIRLRWEIEEDLAFIFADPTHIHQVLLNLCVNARDAMPEGGDLHVQVENATLDAQMTSGYLSAQPGAYVVFHVKDSGTGMSPEVVEKIFDPFFTTKGSAGGTGLGLATLSTIVKSLGGFIDVQSQIGKGTHFRIYIPALDGTVEETVSDSVATPKFGTGQVVLIVDDEMEITTMARIILESRGYKVLTAGNGAEGKILFDENKEKIDLLLTDMMMPGSDGASLIRATRALEADLKVIVMTGLYDRVSGNLDLEANEVIMKPFDADALLGVVGRVLSKA